jgi:PKD repeat protein
MNFKKLTIVALLYILAITNLKAQISPCGTDHFTAELLKTNPALLKALTEYNDELIQLNQSPPLLHKKGVTRTIPVVFHIIHTYGDENISKAQIEDQMKIINQDYQRLNSDTTATRSIFKGVAADMDIEFKLARIDPNGNCTEGITRTYSTLTDGGDDAVKGLVRWDYQKYLNIWVVKNIEGSGSSTGRTLGYSYLPNFTNSTIDGIVMLADYVGSIGTAANNGNKGRVLGHEIGHWLGLNHPFNNGCGGSCSNSGDFICDTPPVSAPSFGCPTSNNTCTNDFPDQLDMIENFMDYANGSCQNMYTKGQKAVIDNQLNKNPRARNITTANHTATGIFTTPSCSAIADFNTNNLIYTVCEGGSVNFKDYSYNGTVSTYEWTFEGASTTTSSLSNPVITYPKAGNYSVTLKVTNAQGTNTKIADKMIKVIPAVSLNKTPFSEGFENSTLLVSKWKSLETGAISWRRTTSNKYEGNAGLMVNIDASSPTNATYTVISEEYDVSSISGRAPKLRFRSAYRPAATSSSEILTVSVSTDCGQTWKPLKAFTVNSNLGVDKTPELGWAPTVQADWKEQTLDLVNYQNTKNLMIKFVATSRSGNGIYIDNVNIEADLVSINQLRKAQQFDVAIYPNPSKQSVNIQINSEGKNIDDLSILNLEGKKISQMELAVKQVGSEVNYTITNLPAGIYFAKISVEGQIMIKKFVVIP